MAVSRSIYNKGRLTARPGDKLNTAHSLIGLQPLNLDKKRDGYIYIPKDYNSGTGATLAVMLHGAGGDADHGLSLIKGYADENNIILIAPVSRDYSWDIITENRFGTDVIFIDEALTHAFENYNISTKHLAIGGFSDGASYALCLGLINGDLFTHILAFSPGFVHAPEIHGHPDVFISHGTSDDVLPIKPCSERIVNELKTDGFNPIFMKFEGGHHLPPHISAAAVKWFLK